MVLPVLDNAPTAMVAVLLGVSLLWVAVVAAGPRTLRAPALLPLGGVLIVPAVYGARLATEAVRVLNVGDPFSRPFGVHVLSSVTEVSPLLLVPTALALALTGCAAAGLVGPVRRSTWGIALAGAAVVGGLATLCLYDVPLAVVVGTILVVAVAGFVAAERLTASTADDARIVVLALVATAAVLALPSDRMTTGVLLVGCAMACSLLPRTDSTGAIAAFVFPIAFAGFVWSGFNVLGVHADLRAVPVLVVLGGLAIWRPQPVLETSVGVVGILASAAAIAMARDTSVALAVHLTVAGVLVTASSIIHPSRRGLAWPGGLLLAAATWVRLLDLGVHVPEAYTLPSRPRPGRGRRVATASRRPVRDADRPRPRPGPGHRAVAARDARRPVLAARPAARCRAASCWPRRRGPALERPAVVGAVGRRRCSCCASSRRTPRSCRRGCRSASPAPCCWSSGVTWESRMRDVRPRLALRRAPALTAAQRVSSGCTIWRAEWMRDFTVPTGMSSSVGDVGVVQLLHVAQHQRLDQRRDGRRRGSPAPRGSRGGCRRSRSWCAGRRRSGSSSVGSSAERRLRVRYVERALLEATACSQVVKRLRPAKVWIRVETSSSASCAASSASSG